MRYIPVYVRRTFTYNCAFGRRVSPRLIVRREDPQMAAADELLVVHAENRVVAVQEVRVEHDLDTVMRVVEQLDASDLVEDRVIVVVGHVVCRHGRERVPLEREDPPLQQHLVLLRQQLVRRR